MNNPSSSESSLRRSIGTLALAAGIVNTTIGAGIFRLPADMAAQLGATAPFAYLLCAIAMGLIVLCMAEAGSRVSLTGGLYAYVEVAFGRFVGFLAGFALWMVLTFAFDAIVGRAFIDGSFSRVIADYDPRHGGFMLLGMLVLVLAPWCAARLRGVQDVRAVR